ncbi:protein obstructor-E-like [Culex pipiens pallens]|uniref:protein obstructor-E-like n=1 Tax=Culex pipiens pallens TaxID=42434 RepID=UPI0019534DAD|nr:protein obstructor-E-like [Culex pipiens pallens]
MTSWGLFAVCLLLGTGAITSASFFGDIDHYRTNSTNSTTTSRPPCNSTESTTPIPSRNRCTGLPDDTLFPSLNDCSYFVTCQDGLEMELECRPEGTKFDHVREVCDHPENVECYNPDRCELEEDGSIIPSETCTNFHICRNGVKSDEITCVPEGTLFDYNRRVCDHPENVVCWGDEAEVTEPTTEGSGTTLEPTRPPVPEDIPSDICRGIVIDILPHPGDCTQFVVCVLGQPSVDSCPPDFIFYPQIGVCGYGNTETCEIDPRWLEDYMREQERLEMEAMSG